MVTHAYSGPTAVEVREIEAAWSAASEPVPVRVEKGSKGRGRWMLIGALLELVIGAIPAAIAGGYVLTSCDDTSRCDHPPSWFQSGGTGDLFWVTVALAALVTPFGIGFITRRFIWVLFCALAAQLSVVVGTAFGAFAAQRYYPGIDLGDVQITIVLGAIFGLFLATAPATFTAVIGVLVGRDDRRYQVSR